jgi:hypothetical protein
MKKILIGLVLIGLCNGVYANDSTDTDPTPRYRSGSNGYGLIALGGVSIAIGGFATRPERYYNGNMWVTKPFYRQGPRASAIVCGVTLTITGLISAIVNN